MRAERDSSILLARWLRAVGRRGIGGKLVLALPGSPKTLRLARDEIVVLEDGLLVAQARGPRNS